MLITGDGAQTVHQQAVRPGLDGGDHDKQLVDIGHRRPHECIGPRLNHVDCVVAALRIVIHRNRDAIPRQGDDPVFAKNPPRPARIYRTGGFNIVEAADAF